MAKKAVLVGINDYKEIGDLRGCVNDVKNMRDVLIQRFGFKTGDITLLIDKQATRVAIEKAIKALIAGGKKGDTLYFHFSGHGSYVPSLGDADEDTDEVLCTYEMDWDKPLIDDWLRKAFNKLKKDVHFTVVMDCCHSGSNTRAVLRPDAYRVARYCPAPDYLYQKQIQPKNRRGLHASSHRSREAGDVVTVDIGEVLITGCRDSQTSADAFLDGDYNGALTFNLVNTLKAAGTTTPTYRALHKTLLKNLANGGFDQVPQLEGRGTNLDQPFLGIASMQLPGTKAKPAKARSNAAAQSFTTPAKALARVRAVQLPNPPAPLALKRSRSATATEDTGTDLATSLYDSNKNQSAVMGSSVVSFVEGVTAERRKDITNCCLFAQLVAKQEVGDPERVHDWYASYFRALRDLGWVAQDMDFREYQESSEGFEAHQAILTVAAALLGPQTAALQLLKTTLEALQSMNKDSPWITLFNQESQSAHAAKFQVTLAEPAEGGGFLVTLMAFSLTAQTKLTQVLFFKHHMNEATLKHCSGKVTIAEDVLDAIRVDLTALLAEHSRRYIRSVSLG
ncbi:MAG: caspase family protein [Betaproteobacteria bacterium]|nr:caspase family protein [Betaproteobacteria bacterium]